MNKHVQLTLDWTQAAKLPEVSKKSVEPAAPLQETLPGLRDSWPEAPQRRHPARLPVPKPLPAAVGRGNFGEDEHGPVRPSSEEVRAITEYHAEKLIELFQKLESVEQRLSRNGSLNRRELVQEKDRTLSAYQGGLALYAEDFGQPAANRLEAYVRHHASKDGQH